MLTQKKVFRILKKNKEVFYIILAGLFFSMMIVDTDLWQPLLTDLGMPVYGLGFVFAGISLVSAIIPFSSRYLQKFKIKNVFISLLTFRILLFLLVYLLYPPLFLYGAVMFILSESLMSLRHPIIGPYFQDKVPTKVRATLTSIRSMGSQVGLLVGGLLIGFLADIIGVQNVIPLTGIFGLFAIYCFSRLK